MELFALPSYLQSYFDTYNAAVCYKLVDLSFDLTAV